VPLVRRERELFAPAADDLRIRFFFLLGVNLLVHPNLDALSFLLESGAEIARPVLEKDEETKGEKDEQNRPEKRADESHAATLADRLWTVNASFRSVRQRVAPMLRCRMRVPLLDLSAQYERLADPIRREFDEILRTQSFILGPKVEEFERALAEHCGARHAIGVSSGTDAQLAIMMALGIGAGDAVITSAYTFFATGGCIARLGATPRFVDIDPATFNLSPVALEEFIGRRCRRNRDGRLIDDEGRIVRAIVPVHLFGLCCDMDPINQIAAQNGLTVIEDAAQAIGAEYPTAARGVRQAGTMSAAGSFSFYPSKNLGAAGDAGAIVCDDDALAERFRIFRQHGMEPRYFHHVVGGNFRLDALQAAVLWIKLPYLNEWSTARRGVADFYREQFEHAGLTNRITLPTEPYRASGLMNHHIYHQYVIRTPQRDDLQKHLAAREIGSAVYYPLGLHQQKCFAALGYRAGDLPETERAARETLALPIFPELTHEMQHAVVGAIADFLK
jgi:dTDP-4-amino-4,6-dideoxygalactose transaminase